MIPVYILGGVLLLAVSGLAVGFFKMARQLGGIEGVAYKMVSQSTATISRVCELEKRCAEIEKGCVPDYEKAREAASAVDRFNAGIANILNYNQLEAMARKRDQQKEE